MSTSPLRRAVDLLGGSAPGRAVISRAVAVKAPYFTSIAPRFTRFEPGIVEAEVRFRRAVTNHIGSVHAIVMCNLAELVGGCAVELAVAPHLRWIPVGMEVRYESIARTDIRGVGDVRSLDLATPGDKTVPVEVFDTSGKRVFSAFITMRLSAKPVRT